MTQNGTSYSYTFNNLGVFEPSNGGGSDGDSGGGYDSSGSGGSGGSGLPCFGFEAECGGDTPIMPT